MLVAGACASSVMAQYCDGAVAQAVQVKFTDCGDVRDDASVYMDDNRGPLLALTKAPSGYWEADKKISEPTGLMLCSHTCSGVSGCARSSKTVAIDRGLRRVCAARYEIRCTGQAWNLHVDTEPGRLIIYKRLRQTRDGIAIQQQGANMTPFQFCDLAYDEHVELQLQGIAVTIPLKSISVGSLVRGTTYVNHDELARAFQTARRTKKVLSAEENDLLPKLVTFKIDR